jgi:glycosyltransferase involved in cell wall biosynthesis
MKALFVAQASLTKSLGGPKVIVELVEEMRLLGWECDMIGVQDTRTSQPLSEPIYQCFRDYLLEHAHEYDVIDYDHSYLPYPRETFDPRSLFVARSVLLMHHFQKIRIPKPFRIRTFVKNLLLFNIDKRKQQLNYYNAKKTIEYADLVNVSNYYDKEELVKNGIDSRKIVVMPYGISRSRRLLFDVISSDIPSSPIVVFVGTFDYRKGALDFPKIVSEIVKEIPNVKFKLLGAKGLFKTEQEIRRHFPKYYQKYIEIILRYDPNDLPNLLSSCSVGIFPSYIEGFGFGVLEMMASSLPVVAYNAPGPPEMLSNEYLVGLGDWHAMAEKVIRLLKDREKLSQGRRWAKSRSQDFNWNEIAKHTDELYTRALATR